MTSHRYPKLHNAMWPGLVGKGSPGAEPAIDLDTMLDPPATAPAEWAKDPDGNTKRIAQTFREACDIAAGYGERLAAEGEICWGGMHSWKRMVQLLELVDRPKTIGFQADMAHTLLFTMGYN